MWRCPYSDLYNVTYSAVVGEVPVSTGACVLFALKRAVEAARAEQNNYDWFPFRKLQLHSCLVPLDAVILWHTVPAPWWSAAHNNISLSKLFFDWMPFSDKDILEL